MKEGFYVNYFTLIRKGGEMNKSLFGKQIKFWWEDYFGKYESTGIVTEHIIAENCLTVQDDKDGIKYYVGINQIKPVA